MTIFTVVDVFCKKDRLSFRKIGLLTSSPISYSEFWKCQNWIWNEIRFFIEHIRKCQSESTLILFWTGLILNKNGAYIAITHRLDDSDFVKNRSLKSAWFDWLKFCEHTTHCWLHTLLVMVCHQWLIICNMQLNKQLIVKREHAAKCHSVMAADLNIWLSPGLCGQPPTETSGFQLWDHDPRPTVRLNALTKIPTKHKSVTNISFQYFSSSTK